MFFHFDDISSFWMFGMFVMLIIAYLVSIDANSIGENGTMWFLVVLFLPMMGFFAYLIVRSINLNSGRANTSNYNNLGSLRSTPPIREPVRTRRSVSNYEMEGPKSTEENLTDYQFCTNCGFQNILEAQFCKSCGTKLT